jgi:hypothetical protein
VELRFVHPSLRRLDEAGTEVLVCCLAADERPPRGVAGLVDWRLGGRISHLLESGYFTGKTGEIGLVPGARRLPFEKLVFLGVGSRADFGEHVFRACVARILDTLEGLKVRSAVVQLPGRHFDAIAPDRAAQLVLEAAAERVDHDLWTLVEGIEARRLIAARLQQERRRVRSDGEV